MVDQADDITVSSMAVVAPMPRSPYGQPYGLSLRGRDKNYTVSHDTYPDTVQDAGTFRGIELEGGMATSQNDTSYGGRFVVLLWRSSLETP